MTPLANRLAEAIRRDGPMSFEMFMAECLYDAADGYYAVSGRQVGRDGDFRTSVSVGPVFGELIAEWLAERWARLGRPDEVVLAEQGAHDGQLMGDVLRALNQRHGAFRAAATPVLIEPLSIRRTEQEARLAEVGGTGRGPAPRWTDSLEGLLLMAGGPVLFFANELLDAFPVDRWRFDGANWHRLVVRLDVEGGAFSWGEEPVPWSAPTGMGEWIAGGLPVGYETETCPGLEGWVGALARVLRGGSALLFDYGRVAADYFAPHRTAGTLRGYRGHRRCDDPFEAPGETDLTADVNFSALGAAAHAAGLRLEGPERQGGFLTRLAAPRLLERPAPDPVWRRQFLTLTHPDHLGHQFYSIVLDSDPSADPLPPPA